MSTTILRNSTLPQSYQCAVEEAAPTFTSKATGETIKVELSLIPNPKTHFNSSTDIFGNVMKTIADVLSTGFFKCKSKSALVFQKDTGEVIAAAVSDYDAEGENYFFNITFDPNEIKGIAKEKVVNFTDFVDESRNLKFWQIFNTVLCVSHNYAISDENMVYVLTIQVMETLYHWLDVNAKADEVVELVIDDYIGKYEDNMSAEDYDKALTPVAVASVEVVKDVKKMSVQFSEELKAIAKGSNDMNS